MNQSDPKPNQGPGENVDRTMVRPKSQVRPADQVDKQQMAQFVTTIRNAEQQVGAHIIQALQHDDTVAVLTTVAVGPDGQQRVISAALNPQRMQQVQEILSAAEEEREDETPCFGFHCLVKSKDEVEDASEDSENNA